MYSFWIPMSHASPQTLLDIFWEYSSYQLPCILKLLCGRHRTRENQQDHSTIGTKCTPFRPRDARGPRKYQHAIVIHCPSRYVPPWSGRPDRPLANPAVVDGWQHLIFQPPGKRPTVDTPPQGTKPDRRVASSPCKKQVTQYTDTVNPCKFTETKSFATPSSIPINTMKLWVGTSRDRVATSLVEASGQPSPSTAPCSAVPRTATSWIRISRANADRAGPAGAEPGERHHICRAWPGTSCMGH